MGLEDTPTRNLLYSHNALATNEHIYLPANEILSIFRSSDIKPSQVQKVPIFNVKLAIIVLAHAASEARIMC